MAAEIAVGRFTKRNGTGAQSITGVGFQPVAVIFSTSAITSNGMETSDAFCSRGFDTGSACRAVGSRYGNGAVAADVWTQMTRYEKDGSVVLLNKDGAPSLALRGKITALDADGFTFTWDVAAAAFNGIRVDYVAIGGSGVSAVVASTTAPGSLGSQTYTGLGITPSAMFFLGGVAAFDTSNGEFTYYNNFGWANRLGCQGATAFAGLNVPVTGQRYASNSSCLSLIFSTGVVLYEATLTAMAAGSFTLNWTTGVGITYPFAYLALQGVAAGIASTVQAMPTTAGIYAITGLGFEPSAILAQGVSTTTFGTLATTGARGGLGMATTDTQFGQWAGVEQASDPTVCASYSSRNKTWVSATVADPGAHSVISAEVTSLQGVNATGFQFYWSNVGSAEAVLFCALGAGAVSGSCPTAAVPYAPPKVTYPVRRLRRFMLPWDQANRMKFLSRLEVILQAGVGIPNTDSANPVLMLRLSKDGGLTWGNEIDLSTGIQGAFDTRVFTYLRTRARNPVVEIVSSDPVNWAWIQALVDIEEGTA